MTNDVRTSITIQRLITAGLTLPTGKGVARGPTAKHVGREDASESRDVPLAQCLLVPRVLQQRSESMYDCRYSRQQMRVRLRLQCIRSLPVYLVTRSNETKQSRKKESDNTLETQAGWWPFGVLNGCPEELRRGLGSEQHAQPVSVPYTGDLHASSEGSLADGRT